MIDYGAAVEVRLHDDDSIWTHGHVCVVWPLGFAYSLPGVYGERAYSEEGVTWRRVPSPVRRPQLRPQLDPRSMHGAGTRGGR